MNYDILRRFYVEHVRKSLRNRNSPQTSFGGYTSVQRAGFRRGPGVDLS